MEAPDAYNVFRRKEQPALRCAVSEDWPVPAFIQSETWDFGGTVRTTQPAPLGFRSKAANEATRLTGYYLFHAL